MFVVKVRSLPKCWASKRDLTWVGSGLTRKQKIKVCLRQTLAYYKHSIIMFHDITIICPSQTFFRLVQCRPESSHTQLFDQPEKKLATNAAAYFAPQSVMKKVLQKLLKMDKPIVYGEVIPIGVLTITSLTILEVKPSSALFFLLVTSERHTSQLQKDW